MPLAKDSKDSTRRIRVGQLQPNAVGALALWIALQQRLLCLSTSRNWSVPSSQPPGSIKPGHHEKCLAFPSRIGVSCRKRVWIHRIVLQSPFGIWVIVNVADSELVERGDESSGPLAVGEPISACTDPNCPQPPSAQTRSETHFDWQLHSVAAQYMLRRTTGLGNENSA